MPGCPRTPKKVPGGRRKRQGALENTRRPQDEQEAAGELGRPKKALKNNHCSRQSPRRQESENCSRGMLKAPEIYRESIGVSALRQVCFCNTSPVQDPQIAFKKG